MRKSVCIGSLAAVLLATSIAALDEDSYVRAGIPASPRLNTFDAYERAFRLVRDGTVPLPTFEDAVGRRVLETLTHVPALYLFRNDERDYNQQVSGIVQLRAEVAEIRTRYETAALQDPAFTDEAALFAAFEIYVAEQVWRAFRNHDVKDSQERFTSISGIESGQLYTELADAIERGVDDALSEEFSDEANRLRLLKALDQTLFRLREALALQQKLALAARLESALLGQSEAIDRRVRSIAAELRLTEAEEAELYTQYTLDEVLEYELAGETLDLRIVVGAIQQQNTEYQEWRRVLRESHDAEELAWARARMYLSQVKWAIVYNERHGGWPYRSWLVSKHHEAIAPILLARYQAEPSPLNAFFAFYPNLCLMAEPDLQSEQWVSIPGTTPHEYIRDVVQDEANTSQMIELYDAASANPRIAHYLKTTIGPASRRLYFSRRTFLREQTQKP
ncbi:MAG: hypothetical protein ACFB20_04955 [Opitutales bacterium]